MRRQAHTNQALSGNSHLSLRPSPHNRGKNTMGRDRGVRTPLAAATWQAALWPGCGSSRAGPPPGSGVLGSLPLPSAAPGAPRSPRAANPGPEASANRARITPSVRTSPIWGRKKSLICGMFSGLPGYYNLNNRQAGRTLNLPPPRAARLFSCPMDRGLFVRLILRATLALDYGIGDVTRQSLMPLQALV
jgi:hypothetical protein